MNEMPRLSWQMRDDDGRYVKYAQVWRCDIPPAGVNYLVVRDEWNEDLTARTILEVKLIGA